MFLPKSKKKDDGLERDTILSRLNTFIKYITICKVQGKSIYITRLSRIGDLSIYVIVTSLMYLYLYKVFNFLHFDHNLNINIL